MKSEFYRDRNRSPNETTSKSRKFSESRNSNRIKTCRDRRGVPEEAGRSSTERLTID